MDARSVSRRADLPDAVVRYGNHDDAVIDIHLPPRRGPDRYAPRPLVVLLHGGFWREEFDRVHTRPLADALAREGFVVATPEYRRVGGTGELAGGWPTTFDDVGAAMQSLPGLLEELAVPTTRTTVVGHSAGGHLALWLANEPHPIDRVVGLAPVGDLRAAAGAHLGADAVQAFLGGPPEQLPERYDAADPAVRLATRPECDVVIIHGVDDTIVPIENSRGLDRTHALVVMCELEGIDHFDVIDPLSAAWRVVRAAAAAEILAL
ncbi:MAG TPA: alpha/beta hydrolase [Nocardioidaceae bacterium]|nr:alpha/beta hydrolase [Nocardioidaceae bacterium]